MPNDREIRRIVPLAGDYTVLWQATDPSRQIGYCPVLARLPNGRLIGNMLVADKGEAAEDPWTVKVFSSDDGGETWVHRKDMAMVDSFPFVAGSSVYVIGGRYDLNISRSDDWGDTWSEPVPLTKDRQWYSYPGSAVTTNGRIYFVKEYRTEPLDGFPVWVLAPVVLSARLTDDLRQPEAWTFSNALSFEDVRREFGDPKLIGVPFYEPGSYARDGVACAKGVYRGMNKIGWGEANMIQINDPGHIWHDPAGRTFHILMRANTGKTNLACLAKAVETEDGRVNVSLETAPSGEPMLYVPLPGGHGSFHIVYDEETRLYWLISSQSTDSMKRAELMHPKRYGLPDNERRRLVLHFSRNCIDWCFAGLATAVDDMGQSHYGASMVIDGDDLLLLMRTANPEARNAHDSNTITFHRIRGFRELAY